VASFLRVGVEWSWEAKKAFRLGLDSLDPLFALGILLGVFGSDFLGSGS
jgi:hypothetical protein